MVAKPPEPGNRQPCKGCWGRLWLVGSLGPGITSTGMAAASWLSTTSISLHTVSVTKLIGFASDPLQACCKLGLPHMRVTLIHTMSYFSAWQMSEPGIYGVCSCQPSCP